MKSIFLITLALLTYFLASCSEKAENIDPKALSMLDEGIGKYRKIVTSLRNSGLDSKELRDLANDADFSLRELNTYMEAKKISLEAIGISDLGEVADEFQGLLDEYNAKAFKPYSPDLWGKYSLVSVDSKNSVNDKIDLNHDLVSLIYFQDLIKRYPSLATEFHWQKDGEDSSYTNIRVPPEAIKFASEFEISSGDDQFLKGMKSIPDSGHEISKYSKDPDDKGWWTVFFDGDVVRSLLINDLSERIDKVNLLVKGAM